MQADFKQSDDAMPEKVSIKATDPVGSREPTTPTPTWPMFALLVAIGTLLGSGRLVFSTTWAVIAAVLRPMNTGSATSTQSTCGGLEQETDTKCNINNF
jgi:hypothetical protein